MIFKSLHLFSQNVCKNRILTDKSLENKKDFDILFIQKPPWSFICTIPSSSSEEGYILVDAPNHLDWLTCVSLSERIFSITKTSAIFLNNSSIFYIINIYSDNHQTALKYLKDTEANLHNVLVMTENFNIKDR